MYGLDGASYSWYKTLRDFLQDRGCKKPLTDPAFFYYHREGRLAGIITTWVNDVFSCGSKEFQKEVMEEGEDIIMLPQGGPGGACPCGH